MFSFRMFQSNDLLDPSSAGALEAECFVTDDDLLLMDFCSVKIFNTATVLPAKNHTS